MPIHCDPWPGNTKATFDFGSAGRCPPVSTARARSCSARSAPSRATTASRYGWSGRSLAGEREQLAGAVGRRTGPLAPDAELVERVEQLDQPLPLVVGAAHGAEH